MPMRQTGVDAQGRERWARVAFRPSDYTVPSNLIALMRENTETYGSRELFTQYDGPFSNLARVREVVHDGKTFAVCVHYDPPHYALEIELTDHKLGEIRALPPEEAWKLSRERDESLDPPVPVES
jgi:hypothetical protein